MVHGKEMLIPLFPLNVVLYPGMLMPLHIFEPRYRAMIDNTMQESQSFAIALIDAGEQEGDLDVTPKAIGTVAQIAQLRHLDPEKMNVWVVGDEKVEILDYHRTADNYLMARVRVLQDDASSVTKCVPQLDSLHQMFDEYITLKLKLNDRAPDEIDYDLSGEPETMSYQIASLLDISLAEKQMLLELSSVVERLTREAEILAREMEQLHNLLKTHVSPQTQSLPWGGEVNLN